MPNEIDYKILSEHVYWIDKKDEGYDPSIKEEEKIKEKDTEYNIIKKKKKKNTTNDMQEMDVATIKNGTAYTSEVVIAYAGTNFDDEVDIHTDLQTVIGRGKDYLFKPNGYFPLFSSIEDSQIATAEK